MREARNMTLQIQPVTNKNGTLFHGFIVERPSVKASGPVHLKVVLDLMAKAGKEGFSSDYMDYKLSYKTEPIDKESAYAKKIPKK